MAERVSRGAAPAGPGRAFLRIRRRDRVADRLERAYAVLLALLIGVAILAGNLPGLSTVLAQGPPEVPGPGPLLGLGLLWYAAVLAGAARFGPLAVGPARLSWLLPSPVGRRGLLWPTAVAVLGLATVAGLLHGTFVAWALAAPGLLLVALAGGIAGLFVGGLAVLAQTLTDGVASVLDRSALLLAAGAAVLTVVDPSVRSAVPGWLGPWAWPQAVAGGVPPGWLAAAGVTAVLVAGLAFHRLDRVRLTSLAAGGVLADTVSIGVVTLDPGIAARAVEDRRWAARALRRTGLPRLPGRLAVLGHDLTALRRSPDGLALVAATALVPALLAGVAGAGPVLAGAWLLSGLLAVGAVTGNARRDRDLPALGGLLGLSGRVLVAVRSVLPAAVGTLWGAAAMALLAGRLPGAGPEPAPPHAGWSWWLGAGPDWLLLGAAAGPALAVGALRAARRGAVRHELPPLVTPMGAMPVAPLHWLVTGVDLGLLCTLPTLLAVAAGDPAGMLPVQVAASLLGLAGFVAVAGASRMSRRSLG